MSSEERLEVLMLIAVIGMMLMVLGSVLVRRDVMKADRQAISFEARWWHFETDDGWKNQTKTGG